MAVAGLAERGQPWPGAPRPGGPAGIVVEPNHDPGVAHAVETAQGWRREPGELAWRFAADPRGHFVARDARGAVLGAASCVVHSADLAWIGGMVVTPEARHRGVGRALLRACLAHAGAEGVRAVGLDATAAGRPMYEAEGFVAVGTTPRWSRPPGAPRPTPAPCGHAIYPVSACELMDLLRYDAPRFGTSRARWLAAAMAGFPERGFVAFDKATGALSGFVLGREQGVGPLVADVPEAALWLLRACEAAGAAPRAHLLAANPRAAQAFAAAGYRPEGFACIRMYRGPPPRGDPATIYALGGWAVG